jgi:hypothetical protein
MRVTKLIVLSAAAVLATTAAQAQVNVVDTTIELPVRLAEPVDPMNPPQVDTAMVITNLRRTPSTVVLIGYDKGGNRVGRARRDIPGHGLAYVFASELTDANVFLGKVEAVGRGRLTGTAVLLGGPVTDLPAISSTRRVATCAEDEVDANVGIETVITFPVAAAVQ